MVTCLWCGNEIAEPDDNSAKEEITPSESTLEARAANEEALREEAEYVKAFCSKVGIKYDPERICAECWAPMGELGIWVPEADQPSRRPEPRAETYPDGIPLGCALEMVAEDKPLDEVGRLRNDQERLSDLEYNDTDYVYRTIGFKP